MKEWILSVASLILLISIISIILPEGKIGKYVKSMFSLLILLSIVNPLINYKNIEFDYKETFNENEIYLQEDYLSFVFEKQKTSLEKNCEIIIENLGISNANALIEYEIKSATFKVVKVKINLLNAVIKPDKEHIFVIEELKKSVANYLNIPFEKVEIYE